jgi:uncharacterized membrane protein
MKFSIRQITIAGVIAALYAAISLALLPISFGVYQIRVAEALTVLPFLTPAAVPGLFVGCLIANVYGGMGWQDIVFGSLLTLIAGILTALTGKFSRKLKSEVLALAAPVPPVILNALGVSVYLAPIIGVNYWFAVQMIGIGELVACFLLGLPLLLLLHKRQQFFFN